MNMSIGYPWVLWATAVAVAGVVIAHLLSVTRPPALRLPTARFVPEQSVRAVSRATRPSDVWLLLVRVLVLLLAGIALSAVSMNGAREPVATLLVIDAPRDVTDALAWRAAVQRAVNPSEGAGMSVIGAAPLASAPLLAIVAADGVHAMASDASPAALAAAGTAVMDSLPNSARRVSLASLLLRARRAAAGLTPAPDSLQLVVVSDFMTDEDASALEAVRASWPGRIAMVPINALGAGGAGSNAREAEGLASAGAAPSAEAERELAPVDVRGSPDDVVRAAYAMFGRGARGGAVGGTTTGSSTDTPVRVLRSIPAGEDSAFAEQGGALVLWDSAGWSAPEGASVIASGVALVATFARRSLASSEDARTIAWWNDGTVAADEQPLGRGCVRRVGFGAPAGDVLLGDEARGILATLAAHCDTEAALGRAEPLSADRVQRLAGDGALATARALRASSAATDREAIPVSPYTRWLLLAALVLLGVETWLRSQRSALRARDRVTTVPPARTSEMVA